MAGFVYLYRSFEKFLLEIDVCLCLVLGIATNILNTCRSYINQAHVIPTLERGIHHLPFTICWL